MYGQKYTFFLLALYCLPVWLSGQARRAHLGSDGILLTESCLSFQSDQDQKRSANMRMPGFPQAYPADKSFKNFRNVTLANLDGEPGDEIIVGIGNQVLAIGKDSIAWRVQTSGIVRFPPSIGDVDGDGIEEISVLTGYSQGAGMSYLISSDGKLEEGWPRSFGARTLVSSSSLADLDDDGLLEIIFGDIDNGRGSLHVLRASGESFNDQWPVPLPNVPAVTPSIADIDLDGSKDIVINTTREIYVLDRDAQLLPGWPYGNFLTKYSFQSPVITNLDQSPTPEIIGSGHGDQPQYYVMTSEGDFLPGWPIGVPDLAWTFQPPTVIDYEGAPLILAGRPIGAEVDDMLYGWRADGKLASGYPIRKSGGLEGLITVADLDGDEVAEMAFSSNLIDEDGFGLIHAYEIDGTGELPNFPIQVYGWTFLNGATFGDVDGDGQLDMVVLSYTEHLDDSPDTAFVNVFELGVPIYEPAMQWPTYKGSNAHDGAKDLQTTRSTSHLKKSLEIYPNPAHKWLQIRSSKAGYLDIYDLTGCIQVSTKVLADVQISLDIAVLLPGSYFCVFKSLEHRLESHKILVVQD